MDTANQFAASAILGSAAPVPASKSPPAARNKEPAQRNTHLNIHQRMLEVMKKVDYIQKEKPKEGPRGGLGYSIVSHDKVTALVRPHLVEAGIIYYPVDVVVSQDGNRTQLIVSMRFVNTDNPDDFITTKTVGYGVDSQDKGPGKATSYAVKYALLKSLGLETGDDPDNDQEAVHVPSGALDKVSDAYPSMSIPEKIAVWENRWRSAKTEAEFTKSVNDLRRIEPEGSPVRSELIMSYKLAASRFAK